MAPSLPIEFKSISKMLTTNSERREMQARFGMYVKEKCDGCGKLIQSAFVYRPISVTDTAGPMSAKQWNAPENSRVVFCSSECQERAYYGREKYECMQAKRQGEKHPEQRCVECGGSIPKFKKLGARFCSKRCRQQNSRQNPKVAEISSVTP